MMQSKIRYFQIFKLTMIMIIFVVSIFIRLNILYAYPVLPPYGLMNYSNVIPPTCTVFLMSSHAIGVTFKANPYGYGYSSVQYQCSTQYTLTQGTISCGGGSQVLMPIGMFTDAAGTLNPSNLTVVFFDNDQNNNCNSIKKNKEVIISAYISCNLHIGGAFAVSANPTVATCKTLE